MKKFENLVLKMFGVMSEYFRLANYNHDFSSVNNILFMFGKIIILYQLKNAYHASKCIRLNHQSYFITQATMYKL